MTDHYPPPLSNNEQLICLWVSCILSVLPQNLRGCKEEEDGNVISVNHPL